MQSNIEEATDLWSLLAIEFNKDTLLEPQSGKLPTSSISALNAAKPDALQRKNLMKVLGLIIQANLEIKGKVSMNYAFLRHAPCLTPDNISQKKKTGILKFGKLVTTMHELQHWNAEETNKAKNRFEYFIDSEVNKFAEEICPFDIRNDRLDVFFRIWLHQSSKYSAMWKVMIFVFTVGHGQAQIEGGFNIYSDLLVQNMLAHSVAAQRSVYDVISKLQIILELVVSVLSSKPVCFWSQCKPSFSTNRQSISFKTNKTDWNY